MFKVDKIDEMFLVLNLKVLPNMLHSECDKMNSGPVVCVGSTAEKKPDRSLRELRLDTYTACGTDVEQHL